MIDLDREKPLTLREATKLPALSRNGRRPHIATLWRWCSNGIKRADDRMKLESVVIGGARCTTREAVLRFIERLTTGADQDEPTQLDYTRQHREAMASLAAAGV